MESGALNTYRSAGSSPLEDSLCEVFGEVAFAADLGDAIDAGLPAGLTQAERPAAGLAAWSALVSRVARDIRAHPRCEDLLQLFRDQSILSDDQVVRLLDFVYSGLVSHAKGEFAEFLATPLLRKFADGLADADLAPRESSVVSGVDLRAPGQEGAGQRRLGPDAALVGPTGDGTPGIFDVAEIKSYRASLRALAGQVARHRDRTRLGLVWRGQPLGMPVAAGAALPVLCVRPRRRDRGAAALANLPGGIWTVELPVATAELMEAGFRFANWFGARVGAEVYGAPPALTGLATSGQVPNPWPEMTLIEAARNGLTEALYYVGLRGILHESSDLPPTERRARRVFLWLYNSLAYGYERATGDHMHFPAEHPEMPRAPNKIHEWPVLASSPEWRAAMDSFRAARFDEALCHHPSPGPLTKQGSHLWAGEVVMAARLRARCADGPGARDTLRALSQLKAQPWPDLPAEVHAVLALASLADGDPAAARAEVGAAIAAVGGIRRDAKSRVEKCQAGAPWLRHTNLDLTLLDIACVLAALGEAADAVKYLGWVRPTETWVAEFVAADPMLAAIREDPEVEEFCRRLRGYRR